MNAVYALPKLKATYNYRYFLPYAPEWGTPELCNQRLRELVDFCGTAQIDAVQLYVNILPGTYYMPAHSAAEQLHYAQWMRAVVAPALRAIGVSYQLNFQMLLGGTTHGLDMRGEYDWDFMVNQLGEETLGCACPLGLRFRQSMGEMLQLWAATKPDLIWIDDDFRMHNHGGTSTGEVDFHCYCPLHLAGFAKRMGRSYSREEILAGVVQAGTPSHLRGQWLDYLGETMVDTAGWVRACVDCESPHTRLALMTSVPDVHTAEGRDWKNTLAAFSGHHTPMTRPCSGLYNGAAAPLKQNACTYRLMSQSMATLRRICGADHIDFGPELENTRFTTWCKSVANSRFVLFTSALLGAPQITLSLNDLDGSPIAHEPTTIPLLQQAKPALDALAAVDLANWNNAGVVFLDDEQSAKKIHLGDKARLMDLGLVREWEDVLLQCGIPAYHASCAEAAAGPDVVVLEGYTAWLPTDAELQQLLSKSVLLDAEAAYVLHKRGFGAWLGVSVGEKSGFGGQSERYRAGAIIPVEQRIPFRGNRWRHMEATGAEIVSDFIDSCNTYHVGSTIFTNHNGGRVAIYNSVGEPASGSFGDHARIKWLHGILTWLSNSSFCVLPVLPHHGLCVVRTRGDEHLIALANLGSDVLTTLTFDLSIVPDHAGVMQLADNGTWIPLACTVAKQSTSKRSTLTVRPALNPFAWLIMKFQRAHEVR